ncbi:MAG: aminoglycoside phosphotransferase family protein [bacterium]|nr:aminoglycoside phosphotransferase family protein [bacterium]
MVLARRTLQSLAHLFWPPVSTRDLGPWLERYVAVRALPALGLDARESVETVPIAAGRNTIVRRLCLPGLGDCYARAWRYDLLRRPAREHRLAGELLVRAGLRIPELMLIDDSFAALRRFRLEFAIEKAAPGRPVKDGFDAVAAGGGVPALVGRIAGELARLHAAPARATGRRAAWGKPWRPVNEMREPRGYWLDRMALLERRLRGWVTSLGPAEIDARLGELAGRIERFDWGRPVLVHGDFSPGHIFDEGQGGLIWIDFGTVHYGHPAEDLAAVRQWLEGRGLFGLFLEGYARAGAPAAATDDSAIELFSELRLWEKLNSRVTKRAGREAGGDKAKSRRLAGEQRQVEGRIGRLIAGDRTVAPDRESQ